MIVAPWHGFLLRYPQFILHFLTTLCPLKKTFHLLNNAVKAAKFFAYLSQTALALRRAAE